MAEPRELSLSRFEAVPYPGPSSRPPRPVPCLLPPPTPNVSRTFSDRGSEEEELLYDEVVFEPRPEPVSPLLPLELVSPLPPVRPLPSPVPVLRLVVDCDV
jgi:hypothetical protein